MNRLSSMDVSARGCAGVFLAVSVIVLILPLAASAQVQTGTPPFASFGGGPDAVNLADLNDHWTIPVLNKAGRGTNFTYDISYDSAVWYKTQSGSSYVWQPIFNWGWTAQTEVQTGYISYSRVSYNCDGTQPPFPQYVIFSRFVYHDRWGISHPFTGQMMYDPTDCLDGTTSSMSSQVNDGTGYILSATINNAPNVNSATITTTKGLVTSPPLNNASGSYTSTDRNGNILSADSSGHFYDTLSSTTPVLTVAGSGTPASPYTFTYSAPSGGSASYTMKFTTYSVRTNFACSGITDYGTNGTTTANLVSEIDLPDSSKYTLSYEPTPGHSGFVTGRLASITLPQGGTISYSYSGGNNGINCSDGSAATLQRTTPDGTWTYAQVKGTGAASTTTQTDPQGNQTVIQFQGIYETQRQSYQGSTSGTLLQTINTCYNGATSPCTSTAITLPLATRTITTTLPGSANLEAQHVYKYSATGSLTEQDDYDWGSGAVGPLLKKTAITYASLTKISSFRQQVTVTNGSGTVISQTNYNYGDSVTATSGTPQHTTPSGSRGNLLSVNYYTNGSTYLTKSMSYFDTGNVQTATDVNGAQTTYTYGACGNSFPTNVAEPLSLSKSMTWNCTGGVQLTTTDENSRVTTTAYTDPYFWRPASVTDPTTAVTNLSYTGQTEIEGSLSFNSGSSAQDVLSTRDGLGRPHLSQIRETPGGTSFDSTETDYDSDGRPNRVTLPYVGTAGQTNSSAPSKNTTYDALGRVLSISDNSGGTRTYSYAQNTVYITRGPAPAGENTKRRQEQYDALGRLTSVCEITAGTSSAPAGTCTQTVSQTGYWTKYTYDALGRLTGVTQNAQSGSTQARTYVYDLLGRPTSATNPESGMNTYAYDTDSTMCGNGAYTSNGDLVKTTDNAGNCVMRYYDSLHRLTDVGNNHQSTSNPCKRFRYDNTSGYPGSTKPSGLTNLLGRLAEVETDSGSLITDEWFSYTARGEVSDVYESTPHSGGYYHTSATYWANGVIDQLNAPGQYYAQYNVDGEGRIYSTAPSVGALSSTTYNAASEPTQVTFASGDSDTFTYDPNTARMTQYKFTVNGQSLVGNLTWNADHTLAAQNITDPFDSSDQQNCSYTHDDLTRLASVNCGSILSQTFSYDAFGNVSKSGTYQFQPTYNSATNHYASIPGATVSYDPDGNVLTDGSHTYTWDVYGKSVSVDSVNLTYDALGRMVEQNRSGIYTPIVYSPIGEKLELMNGQSFTKAFVPLPGGAVAVYGAGGYYGHPDHLGNIKLGSTTSRTVNWVVAYAPFGESYAASGSTDPVFTGQRQDTVAGLYDFPARQYSIQGRWPNPDPSGLASVNIHDPQQLNRYAYVRNNPLANIDPNGLVCNSGDFTGTGGDPLADGTGIFTPEDCAANGGTWSGNDTSDPTSGGDQTNSGQNCGANSATCGPAIPLDTTTANGNVVGSIYTTSADPNYSTEVTADAPSISTEASDLTSSPTSPSDAPIPMLSGASNNPLDQLLPLIEAQEGAESTVMNNYVIPGAMIGGGYVVASYSFEATVGLCATGGGCYASPFTAIGVVGGSLMMAEGVSHLTTGKYFDPALILNPTSPQSPNGGSGW